MAWVKHEQGGGVNRGFATYSEVVDNDQDKTLTVTTDLGTGYVIVPTFIEVLYTADATAATRVLDLIVTRDAVDVYTLPFDSAAHPTANEVKRLYLTPGFALVEAPITGAADNHFLSIAPVVLGQGDALRIRAASGGQAADDMHIFVHARILSK